MEAERFDELTRSLASRRRLLRRFALGGLTAGLVTARGSAPASAAVDAVTCLLDVRATVRLGPSAGSRLAAGTTKPGELSGQLQLTIDGTGKLVNAVWAEPDGTEFPIAGEATGHQIGMRVARGKPGSLVLQGVGERPLRACKGAVDGNLIGPAEGDLGDWHAVVTKRTVASPSPGATATSTTTGSSAGGSSGGGNSAGGDVVVLCGGVSCPDGQVCYQDACCAPATCSPGVCAETIPDGCGGAAKCGGPSVCASGEVCYLNLCCPPRACQSYECGLHDDGCGGIVDCKDPCGGAGCAPDGTCCAVDCPVGGCGNVTNSCGTTYNCPCAAGSTCVNGSCCAALGAGCAGVPCCTGYCDQDNICECVSSGERCVHVGTGGCCNGDCRDDDTCP